MVKDWTPKRKEQLMLLQTVLQKMEKINRTTGAITDILEVSTIAGELVYQYDDVEGSTFWAFLIQELNKE